MAKYSKEILKNRQRNYYIIKRLWCLQNGERSQLQLYALLDKIPRQTYSRILTASSYNPPNLKYRAERLAVTTQVEKGVWLGEVALSIPEIKDTEWSDFFDLLYPQDGTPSSIPVDKKKQKIKDFKTRVDKKLKEYYTGNFVGDTNIAKLCLICKRISLTANSFQATRLTEIIKTMSEQIHWGVLETLNTELLKSYLKILQTQSRLVNAVIIYKRYKYKK